MASTNAAPLAPSMAEEDEDSYNDQKKPETICSERVAKWKLLRWEVSIVSVMVDIIEDKLSKRMQCLPPCTKERAIERLTEDVNEDIGRHYDTALRAYPIMHDDHRCVLVGSRTPLSETRAVVLRLVQA